MEQKEQYVNEIKAIRQMMEQSSRFLSLSGLSGILIGLYALVGAYYAYRLTEGLVVSELVVKKLVYSAVIVLLISIFTVIVLTYRKTKADGHKIWNKGTKLLIQNLLVPLITGGILSAIFILKGYYGALASLLLIFYGMALVNSSKYTRQEIYYMGLLQIALGILAALLPAYSIILWALGFGVVHIFYGAIMHFRYDKKIKN